MRSWGHVENFCWGAPTILTVCSQIWEGLPRCAWEKCLSRWHPPRSAVSQSQPMTSKCGFGCREQVLTEKMARDSTSRRLWDTPATPLTRSWKAARYNSLTQEEGFYQDSQEDCWKSDRPEKAQFRVCPSVLLRSATPNWGIPGRGTLCLFSSFAYWQWSCQPLCASLWVLLQQQAFSRDNRKNSLAYPSARHTDVPLTGGELRDSFRICLDASTWSCLDCHPTVPIWWHKWRQNKNCPQ